MTRALETAPRLLKSVPRGLHSGYGQVRVAFFVGRDPGQMGTGHKVVA